MKNTGAQHSLAYWLRAAAPYLHNHRGRCFVVLLGGEALSDRSAEHIVHDLALLHTLGIRVVLCFGSRPQISTALEQKGLAVQFHRGLRVTAADMLDTVKAVTGTMRLELEALLSMGMPGSPMQGARVRAASGNFISARPVGVRDGIDHGFTGLVRRVDRKAIVRALDEQMVVMVPPIGYSPSGEIFNLSAEDVALACAAALHADKLIVFTSAGLHDASGNLQRELTLEQARALLPGLPDVSLVRQLGAAIAACEAGVGRAHMLSADEDGALLQELFSRDGSGTLVSAEAFEQLQQADSSHVGGILDLIGPLEESGVLVRRPRERLESEIGHFRVLVRDDTVIACAALYPLADTGHGELACIAVHPDYRSSGHAGRLLRRIEHDARDLGLRELFVLTTEAAHWFLEHDFVAGTPDDVLPEPRRQLYNLQRNSKVYSKPL